ncbi:hypothetical protein [Synechococcus sp. UW179B]|uniref:hypothetical protein n=1 Tax=Synechococcus sp. UW179B TaxID=2575516 RepID=UPI000E0E157E|nr:hypothetical protein [Synechococcus sp. UW179B]
MKAVLLLTRSEALLQRLVLRREPLTNPNGLVSVKTQAAESMLVRDGFEDSSLACFQDFYFIGDVLFIVLS